MRLNQCFTLQNFLKNNLDVKYDENKEFAQALCHLAYNNLDFSERLIV